MQAAAPLVEGRNGILAIIPKEKRNYYTVEDAMQLLGVKKSKAYSIMRKLREELIASGNLIEEYPVGRIPKGYFNSRCGIETEV